MGGRSPQQHLLLPQDSQLLQAWNVPDEDSSRGPSYLPALLLFLVSPRILTGQAENPATPKITFELIKRQQKMLDGALTCCLSAPAWGLGDQGPRTSLTLAS